MAGKTELNELTKAALEVFQPRADGQLSEEDVREISRNLTGFFSVLGDWAAVENLPPSATPSMDEQLGPSHDVEGK